MLNAYVKGHFYRFYLNISGSVSYKDMLEEEFSMAEVKQAIQEANEVSAPGPSGQTIAFLSSSS